MSCSATIAAVPTDYTNRAGRQFRSFTAALGAITRTTLLKVAFHFGYQPRPCSTNFRLLPLAAASALKSSLPSALTRH
ncbi:hypothetical protein KCP74_13870 [Salmonella enterica subsp. enterica]|nr:hypothetical protein KCP74_13870 [Salmonella enterica subsp. enterica]